MRSLTKVCWRLCPPQCHKRRSDEGAQEAELLTSPCFQYNSQDLSMMLLNSRMFLIELNTFMTSLAALAFHLALLLNRCRFGLGFFSPSLELGLLMLMSQISSLSVDDSVRFLQSLRSLLHRQGLQEAMSPGSSMCLSKSFFRALWDCTNGYHVTVAIYNVSCNVW